MQQKIGVDGTEISGATKLTRDVWAQQRQQQQQEQQQLETAAVPQNSLQFMFNTATVILIIAANIS